MAGVGMVVHRDRSEAAVLAARAAEWLVERGHEVRMPMGDAEAAGLADLACPDDGLCDALDLAISLGGDGTMLRAVELVAVAGVPILGVNVGHLGYLTECEPDHLENALEGFFAGRFTVEERMTLEVSTEGKFPVIHALNEAWLEKTRPGHTIHLRLSLSGATFTTYAADGLIVSTPTGSTAYNLSVRGPILSPTMRALIVKPVSPHQLFDLPLVLGPDEEVRVDVLDERLATLLVDGRTIGDLGHGDAIVCRAGGHPARLVRFGLRDFHQTLKAKFGLADR